MYVATKSALAGGVPKHRVPRSRTWPSNLISCGTLRNYPWRSLGLTALVTDAQASTGCTTPRQMTLICGGSQVATTYVLPGELRASDTRLASPNISSRTYTPLYLTDFERMLRLFRCSECSVIRHVAVEVLLTFPPTWTETPPLSSRHSSVPGVRLDANQ